MMNTTAYYTIWAGLFILCAGLGFIPAPGGFLKFCLVLLSLGFFVPPVCLLHRAKKTADSFTIRMVRNLSFASLALTVALIIANFLSVLAPEAVGNLLHILLVIVSAPMICGQYWVVSLFLWAFMMLWSNSILKKK